MRNGKNAIRMFVATVKSILLVTVCVGVSSGSGVLPAAGQTGLSNQQVSVAKAQAAQRVKERARINRQDYMLSADHCHGMDD